MKLIGIYIILMYTILIISFICIIIIAINSIIIAARLKKLNYKLIEIDLNNKEDTTQICNEIRKIKP
jgi:ABC-type bacteriocin/lantibiotic exporter with double-glycine peptidase domain